MMDERNSSKTNAAAAQPSAELRALTELDLAGGHLATMQRLIEENEGLANEVLRGYEQLNLIFEIAQQIARLTSARDIERVLACRVGALLRSQQVAILSLDHPLRSFDPASGVALTDSGELPRLGALSAYASRVREARQVAVLGFETGAPGGTAQAILGPLVRLDGRVDVLAALRGAGSEPFQSGDMLLLDSVLSFGSQIISNSELHEKLGSMSLEVIRALVAAIDKKDHYTSGHSARVGFLARLTGQHLGLPVDELQTLEWAGLLHDVGKIGVPEEILNKPGKLTPEEFEIVKQHPRMGYEILRPIASFESVLTGVLHHHEAPDGSGYPDGLRGDDIPLFAAIIHVVDVFDALTSSRSYRVAFTMQKAIEMLESDSGTKVDAAVTKAFIRAFDAMRSSGGPEFDRLFGHLRVSGT